MLPVVGLASREVGLAVRPALQEAAGVLAQVAAPASQEDLIAAAAPPLLQGASVGLVVQAVGLALPEEVQDARAAGPAAVGDCRAVREHLRDADALGDQIFPPALAAGPGGCPPFGAAQQCRALRATRGE